MGGMTAQARRLEMPKEQHARNGNAHDRLIVALDFPSSEDAFQLVDQLDGRCRWFKVGLELYLAAGPPVVEALASRGFSVFLDLKLHDIPNTVARAVRSVSTMGASMLTVHASGGLPMLVAAAETANVSPGGPKLLAVTVLTSMDTEQLAQVGVSQQTAGQVLRLAHLAASAGINGFVCSPQEVAMLRAELAPDSVLVVPGIRPSGSATGDQARIATPAKAFADGASFLVVGRPITQALDPSGAAKAILEEMDRAAKAS